MTRTDRNLERAMSRLEKLIASEASRDSETERNEAATRLDLIDDLLMHVLAWPRDQVRPEEHSNAGYADYALGVPKRQLVVEAKREGLHFRLPPETPQRASLPRLFKLDRHLEAAVQQAQSYALAFGLPYAAVCNGHQLVAFVAVRTDGTEPLKGSALAFPSLQAMLDGFADLWDGLSRPGVEARRLSALLAGNGGVAPPAKPSQFITGYPGPAQGTSLTTDLRMLGELFLIDVVEDERVSDEFLRACYLSSGALSQYASVGRQVLQSRYSEPLEEELEVEIASARTRAGVPEDLLSDVTTASLTARPIILLGYVGVGKSMFIRHLVRVDAKDVLAGAIVLDVDLRHDPGLEKLESFINAKFIAQLENDYGLRIFDRDFGRKVYAKEMEDFRRSPWGELAESHAAEYKLKEIEHLASLMEDREAHLRRSLNFLATDRGRQIVTILDNVDQQPDAVQDKVFLIAVALAKSWPGTVFVALRPDTFNRSKRSGALKAYQPRVFAVSPPRIDRVLDKRIAFAQTLIARGDSLPGGLDSLQNADALRTVLEVVRLSLRRSQALAELIDNLSGHNARTALELLTTVIGSPHARPQLAVERSKGGAHYSIPFHDFLRAVMLGDRARYDPAESRIPNVFDISSQDGREHFLLPIAIAFLLRSAEPGVRQGFVPAQRVFAFCQGLGFLPEQISWQLERGVAGELLEPSPLEGPPEEYRSTTIGAYIVKKLLGELTYADEVAIDTPIVDDQTRANITDAEHASDRMRRADRFSRYLDQQWAPLADRESGFDWLSHSQRIRDGVVNVERILDASQSRPRRPRPNKRRA